MPILVCTNILQVNTLFNVLTVRILPFSEGFWQFWIKSNFQSISNSSNVGVQFGESSVSILMLDFVIGATVVILISLLILYIQRLNRTKRYSKILESQLKVRTNKIIREQELLVEQNKLIQEKSVNLRASIAYAKLIQNALLPSEERLKEYFPNAFATVVSKELVSGDFFWLTQKYDTNYLAVVDCTGHGVPGAFMSLIGCSLLEDTINSKGVLTPGNILSDLRSNMLKTLNSNGEAMSNDGMDITLCSYNKQSQLLCYAGANQSLYVVRESNDPLLDINEKEYSPLCNKFGFNLFELKADRQPIGNHYGPQKSYTNYTVKLNKSDRFYAFTDGFRDQFGGVRNKKLKCERFRTMLLSAQNLDMPQQKEQLLKAFHDWKGNLEQNDDMCLVGIKI